MKRLIGSLSAILFVVFAAGMLFAGGQKEAAGPQVPTIKVATDATWPPMEFVNTDKELVGFDVDLINAAAKAGGFKVTLQNTAWDGIFAGLANGDYDAVISSVTITDERKQTMDFSMPYLNAGQVLVVRTDESGVATLADLKGKSAGAQIGTTGAMEIQKVSGVALKTYDEIGLAVEDLANGRIAGVVVDNPTAANYVLQNDNYKSRLKIVGKPFTEEYYGIAVKKGNTKVLDLINAGLKKVLSTSLPRELESKWLR